MVSSDIEKRWVGGIDAMVSCLMCARSQHWHSAWFMVVSAIRAVLFKRPVFVDRARMVQRWHPCHHWAAAQRLVVEVFVRKSLAHACLAAFIIIYMFLFATLHSSLEVAVGTCSIVLWQSSFHQCTHLCGLSCMG